MSKEFFIFYFNLDSSWTWLGHEGEKNWKKGEIFYNPAQSISFLLWNVRDFSSLFDMQLIDTELGSLALLCEVWQCSSFAVLSSNSWTLSVSSLSTCIYPKALFIGWIITPLGLTKWQHPFFFEVLKILGSQIIPHPFSYDTFFFWVWKILGPQPITIVFLPCED